MVTRSESVIAAVGLLLGLTACTPGTTATPSATITPTSSVTSPSVTPSTTPTWSADQQALSAHEAVTLLSDGSPRIGLMASTLRQSTHEVPVSGVMVS